MNISQWIRGSVIALSLLAAQVYAAGLGDLSLNSQLGQPLQASVAVLGTQDYDHKQLIFTVADQKTHQRLGVEYQLANLSLKMAVVDSAESRQLIISTNRPVNEPYIEFVLSMKTPSGVYLKTVSLLLDTPDNSSTTSAFGKP